MTKDEFLLRASSIHGSRYDYSNIKFVSSSKKIDMVCREHGVFNQLPEKHLIGRGCPKCASVYSARKRTRTSISFISLAKNIHGERYDYSKVSYKLSTEKIKIVCVDHGEFLQTPSQHLAGSGCSKCGYLVAGGEGAYCNTIAERNKDKWKNEFAMVYFVKFNPLNDSFHKIGISSLSVKDRFRYRRYLKFNISEIFHIKTNKYNATYIESELLKSKLITKYVTKDKFGGHTECFKLSENVSERDIIKLMKGIRHE